MEKKRKFAAIAVAAPSTTLPHLVLRNGSSVKRNRHENIADKDHPTRLRPSIEICIEKGVDLEHIGDSEEIYPTRFPNFYPSSPINKLCTRCKELDFENLLSRTPSDGSQTIKQRLLGPAQHWMKDACTLCCLLYSLTSLKWRKYYHGREVQLEASSSKDMKDKIWGSIDTRLLQVQESFMKYQRHLVLQTEGLKGPVNIIEEYISRASFDNVKGWIHLCQENHTKVCSVKDRAPISRFKLIDCKTRSIVSGENHQYLALSYVWGRQTRLDILENDSEKLPSILPNTIVDAIYVTRRLGFRYLWIDRYCIDQNNKDEVVETCGKMDLIYQYAELTIIAAIGNGPEHGLPGVRSCERKMEHLTACAKIDKSFLISCPAGPALAAFGEWSARGWTYQEGLLSRRRLVFTEEQMYFECYGMFCCESVDFPLDELHQNDTQGFKREFYSENRVGIFPRGVGATSIEIFRRIEEYSELKLSNPLDILQAMQGILSTFHRVLGIQNCLGIPILPADLGGENKHIVGWTPTVGFVLGLMWNNSERCRRRDGFPSWSWTGWHSSIKWGDDAYGELRDWPSYKVDPDIMLNCEMGDEHERESVTTQFVYEQNLKRNDTNLLLTNFITITAWTIEIWIRKRNVLEGMDNCQVEIELQDGGYLVWKFFSFSEKQYGSGDQLTGIILGESTKAPPDKLDGVAILIVMKVGDIMERIALASLFDEYIERYDKQGIKVEQLPEQLGIHHRDLIRTRQEVRLG